MENKSFGANLRKLRLRENLSVKEVIEKLSDYGHDITDKTLYSYENDKRAASADMFITLCRIYKCNNILETFAGMEPDYSIPDDTEWNIIEKYRILDEHGKEMVDFTLLKEWERVKADIEEAQPSIKEFKEEPNYLSLGAAHNEGPQTKEELDLMREDAERLKNL